LIRLRRPTDRDETAATLHGSSRPNRELLLFIAVALLALVIVGTASAVFSARWARDTAVDDARQVATRLADYVAAPLLETGNEEALEDVLTRRLEDREVLLAQVWYPDRAVRVTTEDGGPPARSREVNAELERAFAGEIVSHLDEDPETELPGVEGPVLEVYAPFGVGEETYVLEAYINVITIQTYTTRLRGQLLPFTVGALVVLQAVQIPMAISMARRLTRQETERRALVQDHLAASERERREIAADVHDGPVQDLAGVSYALSALRGRLPEDQRPIVDRMTVAVRGAVASLRRLMVDIYPPDLSGSGLAPALEDLAGTLREKGIAVQLSAEDVPGLPKDVAALLYRSSKEALANVVKHSEADRVWIELGPTSHAGVPRVQLTVADDGVGLPGGDGHASANGNGQVPAATDDGGSRGEPHLGLRLVRDRVIEAGGTFSVTPGLERGTVFCVDVPLERAPPG
jgi:two-component system, NarL family, sensor kinase